MIAGGLVAAPLMSAAYQAGKHEDLQRLCKSAGTHHCGYDTRGLRQSCC